MIAGCESDVKKKHNARYVCGMQATRYWAFLSFELFGMLRWIRRGGVEDSKGRCPRRFSRDA
jgi:hypothetical protein